MMSVPVKFTLKRRLNDQEIESISSKRFKVLETVFTADDDNDNQNDEEIEHEIEPEIIPKAENISQEAWKMTKKLYWQYKWVSKRWHIINILFSQQWASFILNNKAMKRNKFKFIPIFKLINCLFSFFADRSIIFFL